jgi:hypothetical protein
MPTDDVEQKDDSQKQRLIVALCESRNSENEKYGSPEEPDSGGLSITIRSSGITSPSPSVPIYEPAVVFGSLK